MPYPFLRPDEIRHVQPQPERKFGLLMWVVVDGRKRRFFFPGSTPYLAASLALTVLSRDMIETEDSTRVEWGTFASGEWRLLEVMKHAASDIQNPQPVTNDKDAEYVSALVTPERENAIVTNTELKPIPIE